MLTSTTNSSTVTSPSPPQSPGQAELRGLRVAVAVAVAVRLGEGVAVGSNVAVAVRVAEGLALGDTLGVGVGERLGVAESVAVADADGVGVALADKVEVGEGDRVGEKVTDALAVAVPVRVGVNDTLGVAVPVLVNEGVGLAMSVGSGDGVSLGDGVALGVRLALGVGLAEGVALAGAVAVRLADAVAVGSNVAVAVRVAEGLALGDTLGVGVGERLGVAESVAVAEARGVGVALANNVAVELGEGDRVGEKVTDALAVAVPVRVGVNDTLGVAVPVLVDEGVGLAVTVGSGDGVSLGDGVALGVRLALGVGLAEGVAVRVPVGVGVEVGRRVWVAVGVRVLVGLGVGVRVTVAVGGAVGPVFTFRLANAARSPEFAPLPLTAFPQARRANAPPVVGAVHKNEKRIGFPSPPLRCVCVISPFKSLVPEEWAPPTERVPALAPALRPPQICEPTGAISSTYSFVDPGVTVVGPLNVTAGTCPPEWHWLHPAGLVVRPVIPLEKASARRGANTMRQAAPSRQSAHLSTIVPPLRAPHRMLQCAGQVNVQTTLRNPCPLALAPTAAHASARRNHRRARKFPEPGSDPSQGAAFRSRATSPGCRARRPRRSASLQQPLQVTNRAGCAWTEPSERLAINEVHRASPPGARRSQGLQARQVLTLEPVRLVGKQNDFRVGVSHLLECHFWVASGSTGANVLPAAQRKQVRGEGVRADTHPRVPPDRDKDPAVAPEVNSRHPFLEFRGELLRRRVRGGKLPQAAHEPGQLPHPARVRHEHAQAGMAELFHVRRAILLRVRHHQVRRQGADGSKIRVFGPAHPG